MFTSREPGQFPRDPAPWIHPVYENRYPEEHSFWVGKTEWFPRPEFNTPVNPALQSLREDTSSHRVLFALDYLEHDADIMTDWTPEQIEHARKVLTRLAALIEGSGK